MKYKNFGCFISRNRLMILPTIILVKDEPQYFDKNFAIELHWLCFHLRWFWIKEYWK